MYLWMRNLWEMMEKLLLTRMRKLLLKEDSKGIIIFYADFLKVANNFFLIQVKIIHYEKSYLNVLISHIGELNPLYNLFGMQF